MLRILLTILLPVILPLALYFAYVKFTRPQSGAAAVTWPPPLGLWLALGTAVLLVAGMLTLGMTRGVPPGTKLIAPRLENGVVIPSQRVDEAR